jgi:hypothetical protein
MFPDNDESTRSAVSSALRADICVPVVSQL